MWAQDVNLNDRTRGGRGVCIITFSCSVLYRVLLFSPRNIDFFEYSLRMTTNADTVLSLTEGGLGVRG